MVDIPEATGLFAILGALAEVGALTPADEVGCRERLVRLTGVADVSLTKKELTNVFSEALAEARAMAVKTADFTASPAYVPREVSHRPTKRPRIVGLNSSFT